MIRTLHILFVLLTFSFFGFGQVQDLTKLAEGKLVFFEPIYNAKEEVDGYFAIYKYDNLSEENVLNEYVVLDTDLQKKYNGTFKLKSSAKTQPVWMTGVKRIEDKIVVRLFYNHYHNVLSTDRQNSVYLIDIFPVLKQVSEPYKFNNNKITSINYKNIVPKESNDFSITRGGVFTYNYFKAVSNHEDKKVMKSSFFVDANNRILWEYKLNKNPKAKKLLEASYIETLDNQLFIVEKTLVNEHVVSSKMVVKDEKRGGTIFEFDLQSGKRQKNLIKVEKVWKNPDTTQSKLRDQYVLICSVYGKNIWGEVNDNRKGFSKIVVDNLGNILEKKTTNYKKYGKSNKFRAINHPYFFQLLNDGSMVVLSH
ncbi:MAG: hypothetical protein ACRCVT_16645, partial [Leadbetterella sp.]